MLFAAFLRKLLLMLALGIASALFGIAFFDAMGAGNALGISIARQVLLRQGAAASEAQFVIALYQAVADRNAAVEDEAFAFPLAFLWRDIFEIFEDAALEVEHILDTFGFQEAGRLFAAYAAGAIHGDFGRLALIDQLSALVAEPFGEVAERLGLGVNRAFELANRDLIIIARVYHDRVGIGDQIVPIMG